MARSRARAAGIRQSPRRATANGDAGACPAPSARAWSARISNRPRPAGSKPARRSRASAIRVVVRAQFWRSPRVDELQRLGDELHLDLPARRAASRPRGPPAAGRAACARASLRHRRGCRPARRRWRAPRSIAVSIRARSAGGPATTRARVSAMRSQVQALRRGSGGRSQATPPPVPCCRTAAAACRPRRAGRPTPGAVTAAT